MQGTQQAKDTHAELVTQVCQYIYDNLDTPLTLDTLGETFHVSPYHLQRVFKRQTGVTPRQYTDACRMGKFKEVLREGERITDALYEAGYGSTSRLYERTDGYLGMTPSDYQKGGEGIHMMFNLRKCPLGWLLVAATERGICAIKLGDDPQALVDELVDEYPAADMYHDEGGMDDWFEPITSYLQGWQPHIDLPIDIRATAFQQRVWDELQRIPYGETRTYGDIARAIGQPTAARAVGRACATNPVALLIPCHRVVRGDGEMGGYRWQVKRKETLLKMERDHIVEDNE